MRLLVIGNIPVDLVMRVPRLPGSGDDVEAQTLDVVVGGSFHVIRAAAAAGLAARFTGTHGTGGYGDLVRSALSEIGADVVQSPLPDRDTGVVVTLVEPGGERSFVTGPHAVISFSAETLDRVPVAADDLVYVSGYSLGSADSRPLARWLGAIPRRNRVFCDLGPRGVVGDGEVLDLVLRRVDWLACNLVEAAAFTGERDPAACARSLAARTAHATALVRAGAAGCWIAAQQGDPELVIAERLHAVGSTSGAGDTHSGAFLAAVSKGLDERAAVGRANAAVARFLSRETVAG